MGGEGQCQFLVTMLSLAQHQVGLLLHACERDLLGSPLHGSGI